MARILTAYSFLVFTKKRMSESNDLHKDVHVFFYKKNTIFPEAQFS